MNQSPLVKTKIQLMDETPYKLVVEYPFLYSPSLDTVLYGEDKEYKFDHEIDRIQTDGTIIRYIRFR